ncbi:MAG TPA: glycosyltransferase family 39 protein [Candidatus Sulfotelmatobacter sp.]|nr:glycosyltransferase family 39 protein [Candidatus Sulfotelmatobacter sp.]
MNLFAASQTPSAGPVEPESRAPVAKHQHFLPWLLIFGLWAAVYVTGMFTPALLDDVDSVHSEAAREMLQRHDWVTLHTDGIRYLEKAPLPYWSVAISYKLFGMSDWATRLPLLLTLLALLFVTYKIGEFAYSNSGGLWAAIVLATSIGPYIYTRFQIPDVAVGLWLAVGFLFFLRTLDEEPPSRMSCWGLAVACALNVLTKGLIGLIFPVATIGLYLVLTGKLRHLLRMRLVSSLIVFLIVAVPWHVMAALRNPPQGEVRGFLWLYFVNEHFLRYVNKRVPPGYDTVPLAIFWGLVILWLIPWSIFLPQSLRSIPWRRRELRGQMDRSRQASLLFALWALVIVGFFSFSTRQEYYTIPALPGLALLIGGWLANESSSREGSPERRAGRISSSVLFAVALVGAAIGVFLLLSSHAPAPGVDLADLLKKNPQDYDFSLGHFFDLTPQALGAFRAPLLGTVIFLSLGSGLNWFLRRRGKPVYGNGALVLMMIGLLACVHSAFVTFSPILSSHELAVAIKREYRPGDLIVVDGRYDQASTLNFYTGVPLLILHEPSGNLWYGSHFPDAPHVWETQASFNALWAGPQRVFLWTDKDAPEELAGQPRFLLARSGGKSILTNRKPGD